MISFISEVFMKNYELKIDTKNESELQRVYSCPKNSRVSKFYPDKGFLNIDNGSQGGTHWVCFIVNDNKSYYFDSYGGKPDKVFIQQLPKPIKYQKCKIQDMNSKKWGSYCL